jgi:hypothetical protein
MTISNVDLPIVNLYGLAELQQMALLKTLSEHGIEDPAKFLEENIVRYVPAFKASVGLTIVITEVKAKTKKESDQ